MTVGVTSYCVLGCGRENDSASNKDNRQMSHADDDRRSQFRKQEHMAKRTVKQLIGELGSRNTAPELGNARRPAFAQDFDWQDQYRIQGVWSEILARASEGIGDLLDHCDDDRYCITISSHHSPRNLSVGDICWRVVKEQVEGFIPDGDYRPVELHILGGFKKEDIRKWCEEHRTATLADLQLEAIRQVRNKVMGSTRFGDDWKSAYAARLDKYEDEIKSTGEAIAASSEAWDRETEKFFEPDKSTKKGN